jgi:hypothetical protein
MERIAKERAEHGVRGIALCPNVGSIDYLALFRNPDAWAGVRQDLSAFKVYVRNVCAIDETEIRDWHVGPNTYTALCEADIFRLLKAWGIPLHMEAAASKAHDPKATSEIEGTKRALQYVRDGGGDVDVLCMDEPLTWTVNPAGEHKDGFLNLEQAGDVARWSSDWCHALAALGPQAALLEAYPGHTIDTMATFIRHMVVENKVPLAFFELDIDLNYIKDHGFTDKRVRADLQRLKQTCSEVAVPFRVIATGTHAEDSSKKFRDEALKIANLVKRHIAPIDGVTVQSWAAYREGTPEERREIPPNLPAGDDTSLLGVCSAVREMHLMQAGEGGPPQGWLGGLWAFVDALLHSAKRSG